MSYSSGSNSYYRSERDKSLPPLKEHLRDVYYKTGTSGHSSVNSHPSRVQPSTQPSRHPSANSYGDIENSSYPRAPSHSSSHNSYAPQTHSTRSHRHDETESSGHQYSVYNISTGHLVHESSSVVDRFPSKPLRATDDPRRQHVCNVCHERFDRPGGLETHLLTHTPEIRPFKCSIGNCQKTFNVASNLRRHEKIHFAPSQFETIEEDDHHNGSSRSSSSSQTSTFSANPSYYSSSRRK